jgi:flagellar motor protein MotB
MQVSVNTMVSAYAAQSIKGPTAQLAFRLHASEEKENTACREGYSKAEKQQKKEKEQHEQAPKKQHKQEQQQKRPKLEHHHHQQQQKQQKQQQQQLVQQQQQLVQQQQQQQLFQQQLFQQQLLQQHRHVVPMPWLQSATSPMPALETAQLPYGRALSTLRHKYDGEIKTYFESIGFCVKNRPEAARVAAVFQELCRMRASSTLPKEAKWFEISATWFDDAYETVQGLY